MAKAVRWSGAVNVILEWDPGVMELIGVDDAGPYDWLMSGFFSDAELDGLNADCGPEIFCEPYTYLPYNDGDGYYQAIGNFSNTAVAPPSGLLVSILEFRALSMALGSELRIVSDVGGVTTTAVVGESGQDVLGALGTCSVNINPAVDWGMLSLSAPVNTCLWAPPGGSTYVDLVVSDLAQPVNGVQALVQYDETRLTFVGATGGDGLGSPWDAAAVAATQLDDGVVSVGGVLLGGSSDADSVVAELEFVTAPDITSGLTSVELLVQFPPLVTKLTNAATAEDVYPEVSGLQIVELAGDIDAEGDVDLADYAAFAVCYGSDVELGDCCCFDFDSDGDVDGDDYYFLHSAWTGPLSIP